MYIIINHWVDANQKKTATLGGGETDSICNSSSSVRSSSMTRLRPFFLSFVPSTHYTNCALNRGPFTDKHPGREGAPMWLVVTFPRANFRVSQPHLG
jgi:hypothetical protein